MALELSISTGSGSPIYKQIVDQIAMAIASGQLAPGDTLPSVRALAERLVINPNTVAKAYADLSRDGLVAGQPGRGLTVVPRRRMLSTEERNRRLDAALEDFAREVAFLEFDHVEIFTRLGEKLAEVLPLRNSLEERN